VALTRWGGDPVEDADGYFFYLRDLDSGRVWSTGLRPSLVRSPRYETLSAPGRFETSRVDKEIEASLEVCVSPISTLELRRLRLRNRSRRRRRIELTSYVEVALSTATADAAHPALSKLFVRTQFVAEQNTLLARRTPRGSEKAPPWLFHALLGAHGHLQCETDRARFLGRCARAGAPRAMSTELSGTTGTVLDPVLCLRDMLELEPAKSTEVTYLLGTASDRAEALDCVWRFSRSDAVESTFVEARGHARDQLERLGLTLEEEEYLHALACAMHYGRLQTASDVVERGHGEPLQPSSDLLVADGMHIVLRADGCDAGVTSDLLDAHRYWRALGLPIDLIVVCDDVPPSLVVALDDAPDRVRVMRRADVAPRDLEWLEATARLVVETSLPDLAALLHTQRNPIEVDADGARRRVARHGRSTFTEAPQATRSTEALEFFNGTGGFAADGSEYVIRLRCDDAGLTVPPRPWINVIANESFGFLVSETGAGCTWSRNSREHRLTPWYNDPVLDPHGEALYLRDEESGEFWSPLAGPAPAAGDYEMRHGFGYSTCQHASHGLEQQVLLFAHRRAALKITTIRLVNHSGRARTLSLFAYRRLVLGATPAESARFVVTELDDTSNAILARNPMAGEFADGVTFAGVVPARHARAVHFTCDRTTFIGRNGDPARPAALSAMGALDGRTGTGCNPCIAQQVALDVPAGEAVEVCLLFGEASSVDGARSIIDSYPDIDATERACHASASRRRCARSTSWSMVGCRIRRSAAAFGDDRRCISRVERSVFATSCRTQRRSSIYRPTSHAPKFFGTPASSSSRGTCSTGGIRPTDAAFARAASTICCGCRGRLRSTYGEPATGTFSTSARAFSPRRSSRRERTRSTCCLPTPARRRISTSTAAAPSIARSRRVRTVCRFSARATGTTG
jgi:cyclic beta-1,2-glucan synthetase